MDYNRDGEKGFPRISIKISHSCKQCSFCGLYKSLSRGRWSKAGCVLTIVRSPPTVGVILLAWHAMRASDVSMAAPGRIIRRWRRFVEWNSALRNVRCEDGFDLEIGEKKRLSLFYNSA